MYIFFLTERESTNVFLCILKILIYILCSCMININYNEIKYIFYLG